LIARSVTGRSLQLWPVARLRSLHFPQAAQFR
jgi:hypothetical protein